MSLHNKLYPFGFVFSDLKLNNLPSYYRHVPIFNMYNFYYDKSIIPETDFLKNYFIIIHGHFIHSNIKSSIPNDSLASELLRLFIDDYNQFLETLDFIGGRYVIIIGNTEHIEIFQDATGARSVYYMTDYNVIASHLHIITDNHHCSKNELVREIPNLKIAFNTTEFSNVHSLIPNFKLNFHSKELVRFFPRKENTYKSISKDEKINLVNYLWKFQLQYYINQHKNIILSLTGGNDSRVSLAMIKDFIDSIEFFTYAPKKSIFDPNLRSHQILDTDRIIVKKILNDIKLNHKFLYFDEKEDNKFVTDKIEKTLHKNVATTHNPFLLKHFIKSYGDKEYLHIRANLLEIGRAYFITSKKENSSNEVIKTFKFSIRNNLTKYNNSLINEYIKNTIDLLSYDKSLYGYHVLDLYYWEHRAGRWHAEVLNETDIAFQTMLPFNMRAIIDLSLSFEFKERKSNYLFKELINKNFPILNFYGENNIKNLYEQTRDDLNLNYKKTYKNPIFNSFRLFQNDIDKAINIKSKNIIYIPKNHLKEGNYAYKNFKFSKPLGFIELELLSNYISKTNKANIKYSIYKNDKLLLTEDVADWNHTNSIVIFNLKKDDKITVYVETLKYLPYKSWEDASKITIKKFKEVDSVIQSDIPISHTSPYSITSFK